MPEIVIRHIREGNLYNGGTVVGNLEDGTPVVLQMPIEEAIGHAWQALGPGWTIRDVAYAIATDADRTVIHREALVSYVRINPGACP